MKKEKAFTINPSAAALYLAHIIYTGSGARCRNLHGPDAAAKEYVG